MTEAMAAPTFSDHAPDGGNEPMVPPVLGIEFEFVRMPDGTIRAVPKSEIQNVTELSTQDASAIVAPKPVEEAQFYVHLSDGSVVRCKESDVPATAGTNAMFGHWQRDGKVYVVIGVYPVETKGE